MTAFAIDEILRKGETGKTDGWQWNDSYGSINKMEQLETHKYKRVYMGGSEVLYTLMNNVCMEHRLNFRGRYL